MTRVPFKVLDIEDDPDGQLIAIGDRVMRDARITVSEETKEAMRQGYMCIDCLEPQTEPFPEVCCASWCDFRIRRDQAQEFAKRFKGEVLLGPQTSIDEEYVEDRAALLRDQGVWLPS